MKQELFTSAILAAAGNSTRMKGTGSKQFLLLNGMSVISHTLHTFLHAPQISEIILSARREDFERIREELNRLNTAGKTVRLVEGGASRQESVRRALQAVNENAQYIAIHDGARPLVSSAVIRKTLSAALIHGAAATGVRVKDTIKQVAEDGEILETPDRTALWAVQTPQIFRLSLYKKAMEYARDYGKDFTDDCQLLEFMGVPVYMVEGEYSNIKITTPEDLLIAEGLLRGRNGYANSSGTWV